MEFGSGRFLLTESSYPWENALVASKRPRLVHIGLPVWAEPAWRTQLYSDDCSQKNFLREYGERLDCVEVSSTFYADIGKHTIQNWRSMVPPKFRFLPKWPRRITHEQGLHKVGEEALHFVRRMHAFEDHLGTTMLQLPPSFTTTQARDLYEFLRILPQDFPISIEFRHYSWFQGGRFYPKLEDYLTKQGIGAAISDTPGQREVFHLSFTGNSNIIRYLSDGNIETDQQRLEQWRQWFLSGQFGGDFHFIMHRQDNSRTPELIPYIAPEVYSKIQDLNGPIQQALI